MGRKNLKKSARDASIDAEEIRQFDELGDQWWNESGPMAPLHKLNPVRMGYIRRVIRDHYDLPDSIKCLQKLKIADIGCGGGLVAEPLCRMGATVTGVDAGKENIKVAAAHAKRHGLEIEYLATSAEKLAASGKKYDVVTALEIIEHVADVDVFMAALCKIVKPGGLLIMSTLNRTAKSYLLGIVAAEYVLRWLPAGTHDWKKFLKPSELAAHIEAQGLEVTDLRGLIYNPLSRDFSLSKSDIDVNYLLTATKG
jgi:2-polyprenyl-6-hydroxyphenyl methylase / 3-demethylubiquinone-9 3-methyltransferase